MDRPNWGTCAGCRWFEPCSGCGDQDCFGDCAHAPQELRLSMPPINHYCSEWEPPEGRVCGNCEWPEAVPNRSTIVFCVGKSEQMPKLWTCPAWRWSGDDAR